ncbi:MULTISPECIES: DUF4179 domain-containing protein [Cohnella]|uniref:DUF4179 domain-containing protein n=1 Tax=Cohnella TaxID=329857 RepID=UPI0009B94DDA|nr:MULTISPECIES: DUF4179 domain-containing protein [Cohnella]MBN2982886.1 DUF4179 domain-containing protein [Cohnella algarum]
MPDDKRWDRENGEGSADSAEENGRQNPADPTVYVNARLTPEWTDKANSAPDSVDRAILQGIERGKKLKSRRAGKRRKRMAASAATVLLVAACLFTIRVSPVFAAIVREIPGMEAFVDLIGGWNDKGLELAMDADLMQPIGLSDEKNGIKLTVRGIIADDQRLVIFYEIRAEGEGERVVRLLEPNLSRANGESLEAMIAYGSLDEKEQEDYAKGVLRGVIDAQLQEGSAMPEEAVFAPEVIVVPYDGLQKRLVRAGLEPTAEEDAEGTRLSVRFPIDREKFAGLTRNYELNETIVAEGQKITFASATVSPLRVYVQLDYEESNAKRITGPGDIRLLDENGTEWQYKGGFGQDRIYFESPYYRQPKELYLEGSWFRALDKNKSKLVIDTERKKLIQAPDENVQLSGISETGNRLNIGLTLNKTLPEDNMIYGLLLNDTFTDASGAEYSSVNRSGSFASFTSGEPSKQSVSFNIENELYAQPLTFDIYDYPNYISQPYRIQIAGPSKP